MHSSDTTMSIEAFRVFLNDHGILTDAMMSPPESQTNKITKTVFIKSPRALGSDRKKYGEFTGELTSVDADEIFCEHCTQLPVPSQGKIQVFN